MVCAGVHYLPEGAAAIGKQPFYKIELFYKNIKVKQLSAVFLTKFRWVKSRERPESSLRLS